MKKIFTEKKICYLFNFMAIFMFFILFYYCIGSTGKNSTVDMQDEHIYFFSDFVIWNLFLIGTAFFILFYVGKLSGILKSMKVRNILLASVCVITGLISLFWIYAGKFEPVADQWYVCVYATQFNEGNFAALEKGGYVARYPQQLGMITLLRIFFHIFGPVNFRAFQYFSALLVPFMVLAGCMIVRILSDYNEKVELYYLLFMLVCFPMYAYTPYVYGDLISTVFSMLALWMLLAGMKRFSWMKLVLFAFFIGLSVQLRKNVLIIVIAIGLVLLIKNLFDYKKQYLLQLIALVVGVCSFQVAINVTYRDVLQENTEIPACLYVIMGLNDDHGFPGWHNGYETRVFAEVGDDVQLAKQKAAEDFKVYADLYKRNPQYMVDFFVRKMNSQWNSPMFHSMAMNTYFVEEQLPPVKQLYQYGTMTGLLEFAMKIYQMVLYGSILYLLITKRKDYKKAEMYLLLIAVFGGFLFSLVWEAKTRYILPYLFMMIPYMALGVKELAERMEGYYIAKKKKTSAKIQEEND